MTCPNPTPLGVLSPTSRAEGNVMIDSRTEEIKKLCPACFVDEPEAEREEIIEKLEDCLDLVAAVKSIKETHETGDITDWEDFERELDSLE
jgi:hypothetical protein